MIPVEIKEQFVILRAENKSYSQIIKQLSISKSSCIKLSKELNSEIAQARADNLQRLYNTYSMTKEARIKNLGKTLKNIDKALEAVDFTALSPKDLLELKLKYSNALQEEYIPITACRSIEANDSYIEQLKDLLEQQRDFRAQFSSLGLTDYELKTELLLLDKIRKAEIETGSSESDNELRIVIEDKDKMLSTEERLHEFNKLMGYKDEPTEENSEEAN